MLLLKPESRNTHPNDAILPTYLHNQLGFTDFGGVLLGEVLLQLPNLLRSPKMYFGSWPNSSMRISHPPHCHEYWILQYGHCAVSNEIISFANNPACTKRLNRLLQVFKCQDASPTSELRLSPENPSAVCLSPKVDTMFPRFPLKKKRANRNRDATPSFKNHASLQLGGAKTPCCGGDQHMKKHHLNPKARSLLQLLEARRVSCKIVGLQRRGYQICLLTKKI